MGRDFDLQPKRFAISPPADCLEQDTPLPMSTPEGQDYERIVVVFTLFVLVFVQNEMYFPILL